MKFSDPPRPTGEAHQLAHLPLQISKSPDQLAKHSSLFPDPASLASPICPRPLPLPPPTPLAPPTPTPTPPPTPATATATHAHAHAHALSYTHRGRLGGKSADNGSGCH